MTRWPKVPLSEVLTQDTRTESITDTASEVFLTIKLYGNGLTKRNIGAGKTPKPFVGYRISVDQFVYSRIDARNGAYGMVPPELDGAVCSKDFPKFDVDVARADTSYLLRIVQAPAFYRKVQDLSFGATNRQRVQESEFLGLAIPLPPLAEQRRIAAILDYADALRTKRREALARLDELTRSIFIDMFGDPARNTRGLESVALGELGHWQSGGTPSRSQTSYFEGAVPWFSSGELGPLFVEDSVEKISPEALVETSAKSVPAGAVLLGMYDTAALKSSIAVRDCSCNQAIAFSLIDPRVADSMYVYFAIQVGRDEYRRLQRGVRQKNLNLSMVRGIRIPNPPLAEQHAFAAHVEQIERIKGEHRKALAELDALFASLQFRAFRGEL